MTHSPTMSSDPVDIVIEEDTAPKPRLTVVGRQLLRARFLMALEVDPPGERKFTAVQKAAYVKWLDFHMAE